MKRFFAFFISVLMVTLLCACGGQKKEAPKTGAPSGKKMIIVSCGSAILDDSYNELSWNALQSFNGNASVEYRETMNENEFKTAINEIVSSKFDFVWVADGSKAEYVAAIAKANPKITFVVADSSLENPASNFAGVDFRVNQAAFLAGYAHFNFAALAF